jgi:hypothetical protein
MTRLRSGNYWGPHSSWLKPDATTIERPLA